jgi:hypothetical protein
MSEGKTTFAVVRSVFYWRVLSADRTHGTFDFQVDAEEAAIKLADKARSEGREAEVLVLGRFGEMTVLDTLRVTPKLN